MPATVQLPSVLPPVVIVCCVADVDINDIADVAALPSVYVMPLANRSATFPAPAVPSPSAKVTPAVWVSTLIYPVQSRERATAPALITTAPLLTSRTASSAAVGATPPIHVPPVVQLPPPAAAVIVAIYASCAMASASHLVS